MSLFLSYIFNQTFPWVKFSHSALESIQAQIIKCLFNWDRKKSSKMPQFFDVKANLSEKIFSHLMFHNIEPEIRIWSIFFLTLGQIFWIDFVFKITFLAKSPYVLTLLPNRVTEYLFEEFLASPFRRAEPFCLERVSKRTSESVSVSERTVPRRAAMEENGKWCDTVIFSFPLPAIFLCRMTK